MNIPAAPLEVDPPTCWKVAGKNDLDAQQSAVLQALCDFRDHQARYANLPPFRILPDEVLVELRPRPSADPGSPGRGSGCDL